MQSSLAQTRDEEVVDRAGRTGGLSLQPLNLDFEFCNLKILLSNCLFHLRDDVQLFLHDWFELSDLRRLRFASLHFTSLRLDSAEFPDSEMKRLPQFAKVT